MIKVHKHVSKLSGLKRLLENTFQNGVTRRILQAYKVYSVLKGLEDLHTSFTTVPFKP